MGLSKSEQPSWFGLIPRRTTYLQDFFSDAGLSTSNTSTATYAHITPPRSAGTQTILVSANWKSRDGGPNLRGIAMLLSLAEFLKGRLIIPDDS